jgi:Xaa-Pro aminopeptidase
MSLDNRLKRLRKKIADNNMEAILITNPINRWYITGFSGSSGVAVVTLDDALLLTDFRYTEAAEKEATCFRVVEHDHPMEDYLNKELQGIGVKSLNFEGDSVSYSQYNALLNKLHNIELLSFSGFIEDIRKIKDAEEIQCIRRAAEVSDEAMAYIMNIIKPGMTEKEVAFELEYFVKKRGVEMFPNFIVASGYRAALPHGYASDKEIQSGEFLMIDFGAHKNGYYSDITRTFVVGKADQRQKEIYDIVYNAQHNALKNAVPGASYKEAFNAAASVIEAAGYKLGHGLGHGVGLEIHEIPFVKHFAEGLIEKNMTFTVEPGIYISGWGGVRIEDTVIAEGDGCLPLTKFSKELIELK